MTPEEQRAHLHTLAQAAVTKTLLKTSNKRKSQNHPTSGTIMSVWKTSILAIGHSQSLHLIDKHIRGQGQTLRTS